MKKFRLLQIISLIGLLGMGACSDFLERKSQDEVVVKTVADYSEFLLGSGYVTYVQYKILYYLDDDIQYLSLIHISWYAWGTGEVHPSGTKRMPRTVTAIYGITR